MPSLRNTTEFFGNRYQRRPSERILLLVIENRPPRPLADLGRKRVRRLEGRPSFAT
jgi:hypothetical protein